MKLIPDEGLEWRGLNAAMHCNMIYGAKTSMMRQIFVLS